jgi:hypothetical protein
MLSDGLDGAADAGLAMAASGARIDEASVSKPTVGRIAFTSQPRLRSLW